MSHASQKGSAFVQVMLLIIIIAGIGTVMMQGAIGLQRDTIRSRGEMQAVQAAEGGLAKARHALSRDPDWGGAELPIGDCRVTIEVKRLAADRWEVRAIAIAHPQGIHGTPVRRELLESIGPDGVRRL